MTRKIAPLTQTRRDFWTLVESDRAAGRMTPELERLAHHTLLALNNVRFQPGPERDHELKTAKLNFASKSTEPNKGNQRHD